MSRFRQGSLHWVITAAGIGVSLAGCGSGAEGMPAEETLGQATAEPAVELHTEPEPDSGPESDAQVESELHSEPGGTPAVFTRIWFDLRGMPHRGPYDVDPAQITGRVELLMQRTRDAAGEPTPRLLYTPGVSSFRAEFYGTGTQALAQCQRAVQAVAPPSSAPSSPRRRLREVQASPCAPIEDAGVP